MAIRNRHASEGVSTTINLPRRIRDAAKALAHARGESLGRLIGALVERAILAGDA